MTLPRRIGAFAVPMLLALSPRPAAAETEAAAATSAASACRRSEFRVVVDVGHSTVNPGAISARGATEYEFNLRLAGDIGQRLIGAGFRRTVVLITPGEPPETLTARVAEANRLRADLFLSVHHDSVPERLLQNWEHAGQPQRYSDRFRGHSIFVSLDNIHIGASLAFARLLGGELKSRGLRFTPHYTLPIMGYRRRELIDPEVGVYRYDQLLVLRDTRMPAVLLEAGSIVNRDEELLVATPGQRKLLADAVKEAVEAFCATRPRPAMQHAVRRGRERVRSNRAAQRHADELRRDHAPAPARTPDLMAQ
jgi:N-acetylmuramoyl-L-alanine amidase